MMTIHRVGAAVFILEYCLGVWMSCVLVVKGLGEGKDWGVEWWDKIFDFRIGSNPALM